MSEQLTSVNPQILIWAREFSLTTKEEATTKFGEKNLNDWENGFSFPTYSQLKELAKLYRLPIAVFFFPDIPKVKNSKAFFRSIPQTLSYIFNKYLVQVMNWATILQLNLYELLANDNYDPLFLKINYIKDDINACATQLRDLLDVSIDKQKQINKIEDKFNYWREKLSTIGIFIFKNNFKTELVSGFCLFKSKFPIICINSSLPYSRQIFTIFHEMYHLISQLNGIDITDSILSDQIDDKGNIEVFCNKFAGEFLVPTNDISKYISSSNFSNDKIQDLANIYGVSKDVILRKFFDLNCISRNLYLEKVTELRNMHPKSKKDAELPNKEGHSYYNIQKSYYGKKYIELCFNSYYSNKISIEQLSDFMNMKINLLETIASQYGWDAL
jgi:Zn-dependent peptidase ImmA (M78 family)